jgi:hypothetical protein
MISEREKARTCLSELICAEEEKTQERKSSELSERKITRITTRWRCPGKNSGEPTSSREERQFHGAAG